MKSIKTAVYGAAGYAGIELCRLLLSHPAVDLVAVTSRAHAGKTLSSVLPRFAGLEGAEIQFCQPDLDEVLVAGVEVAFLALPHGMAAEYALPLVEKGVRVIDLSADFRLNDAAVYEEFYRDAHPASDWLTKAVYGMPELYGEAIKSAQLIAAPGCYPTSIILPLVPLLKEGVIDADSIVVSSLSGVSGAGRTASLPIIFSEVNESLRAYGLPKHRHLSEIEQELSLAANKPVMITFTPHLVPVTRGIHSSITATLTGSFEKVGEALRSAYEEAPFVRLLGEGVAADTAHVTRTNFLDVGWHHDSRTNRLLLTSAEDNLTKGASGQAVQAFNLLHGLPETTGLLNL